jgi:hypothetical protein
MLFERSVSVVLENWLSPQDLNSSGMKYAKCHCRYEILSNVFVGSRRDMRREFSVNNGEQASAIWIENTGS